MKALCSFILLIARICLGAIFLLSGIDKLMHYDATAQYMASKSLPMIPLLLYASAAFEILAALALILACRARLWAILLIAYLIVLNLIFHNFWTLSGVEQKMQSIFFFHNIGLIGGLLYLVCCGPGRCGLDRDRDCRRAMNKMESDKPTIN